MMRRILTLVLPVALAVCAGTPKTSATAAEAAAAPKADRPEVKVGDQWSYHCVDYFGVKSERLWVVTSVDPTGIRATENGQPLAFSPDMNEVESPRRKDTDRRLLSFPLDVDKQWNAEDKFSEHESKTGSEGTSKIHVNVTGYEKVRVGSGEFDAFKLKSMGDFSANNGTRSWVGTSQSTYWYAPGARAIVKIESSTGSAQAGCELVKLQLQP